MGAELFRHFRRPPLQSERGEPGPLPARPAGTPRCSRQRPTRRTSARRTRWPTSLDGDLTRPATDRLGDGPVAFLCAEFGVHRSLPVYSGGLGVLAGDLLKEASDQALPLVGVGLLYRRGYFHQRVDRSRVATRVLDRGRPRDAARGRASQAPTARRSRSRSRSGTVRSPPTFGVSTSVACRSTCSTPRLAENTPLQRWISARLYEGNRSIRLAQYALLGVGAVRALEAMSIDADPLSPQRGTCRARHSGRRVGGRVSRGPADDPEAARTRPGTFRVHDSHTRAGRQRDLHRRGDPGSARIARRLSCTSSREVLLQLGRVHPRRRRRAQWADAARDPRCPLDQRRERPARDRRPRDVARDVPVSPARGGADLPRHQRRASADLDGPADAGSAHPSLRRGLGATRDRPGPLGRGRGDPGRGTLGGPLRAEKRPGRTGAGARSSSTA